MGGSEPKTLDCGSLLPLWWRAACCPWPASRSRLRPPKRQQAAAVQGAPASSPRRRCQRRRRRLARLAALHFVELARAQLRQDVPGEKLALIEMRIAAEDERAHPHRDVALQLLIDLTGIADDRARAAAPRAADAAPDSLLD